jgi:peptidoglycan/LPS O-acetylase OafA/YrhL
MKRIGLYSYAIYLSHYVAIASLQRNFDWAKSLPLVLGASAAISIVYAAGIERFVESRLRVLRKRMH